MSLHEVYLLNVIVLAILFIYLSLVIIAPIGIFKYPEQGKKLNKKEKRKLVVLVTLTFLLSISGGVMQSKLKQQQKQEPTEKQEVNTNGEGSRSPATKSEEHLNREVTH